MLIFINYKNAKQLDYFFNIIFLILPKNTTFILMFFQLVAFHMLRRKLKGGSISQSYKKTDQSPQGVNKQILTRAMVKI